MPKSDYVPVHNAGVWKPADFERDSSWIHELSSTQIREMADAAAEWQARDVRFEEIESPQRFLPSILPLIKQVKAELATRGFVLLRGLPVSEFTEEDVARLYWSLGRLLGEGTTQNAKGDLVCPVTNVGVDFGYSGSVTQRNVRGYMSNADLNYHCDPTDVVGLLCLRKAKTGGASTIVSTQTIFNEILQHHPEHLEILFRGFPYDRKGEQGAGEALVTARIPVFAHHGDRVSCRYARSYIIGGADKLGIPLTPQEMAALDCFDTTARREDVALKMNFEPGDVQLLNNFITVHGRTAYEDHPETERRRFLYRLWLDLGDAWPWNTESETMRRAFARFGNLGLTASEWNAARPAVAPIQSAKPS